MCRLSISYQQLWRWMEMVRNEGGMSVERITYWDFGKWRIHIGDTEYSGKDVDRIAAIENILGDDYDLGRLRELVEADQEGRCAILSAPMKPMVQKPNDTDVYCPRCGETLSGGWPCPEYEDYRKMCQCPNCGESIDDNKVELQEAALKGEQNG